MDFERYITFFDKFTVMFVLIASGPCSDVFRFGKSNYNLILPIPCPTKEENSD